MSIGYIGDNFWYALAISTTFGYFGAGRQSSNRSIVYFDDSRQSNRNGETAILTTSGYFDDCRQSNRNGETSILTTLYSSTTL